MLNLREKNSHWIVNVCISKTKVCTVNFLSKRKIKEFDKEALHTSLKLNWQQEKPVIRHRMASSKYIIPAPKIRFKLGPHLNIKYTLRINTCLFVVKKLVIKQVHPQKNIILNSAKLSQARPLAELTSQILKWKKSNIPAPTGLFF